MDDCRQWYHAPGNAPGQQTYAWRTALANLPQKEKMTDPTYFDITGNMIGSKKTDNAIIHVLAGEYDSIKGVEPPHIKGNYL